MKLVTINIFNTDGERETFFAHESDIRAHHGVVKMRKYAAIIADTGIGNVHEVFDKEDGTRAFVFQLYVSKHDYISIYVEIADVKVPMTAKKAA